MHPGSFGSTTFSRRTEQAAGGAYLWKSRDDADRLYTAEWRQFISKTYGAEPKVEYFETPVIVDNLSKSIEKG